MKLLLLTKVKNVLEREFMEDLVGQGYEYLPELTTPAALLANMRTP